MTHLPPLSLSSKSMLPVLSQKCTAQEHKTKIMIPATLCAQGHLQRMQPWHNKPSLHLQTTLKAAASWPIKLHFPAGSFERNIRENHPLPLLPCAQPPLCIPLHGECLSAKPIRVCKNTLQVLITLKDCLTVGGKASSCCTADILQHACH